MTDFLTFTLAAPLAAMGEIAVGERRGSWTRPGHSAVLGLVAACLGLDRVDAAAHAALETGYDLALRVEWVGPLLADYHTAKVPPARRNRRFATRAEELAGPSHALNTILSRRDYHADLLAFAALWPRHPAPRWGLDALAEALRKPAFTPYLGRKSCPLMLPFQPCCAAHADPRAALHAQAAALRASRPFARLDPPRGRAALPVVTMDAAVAQAFGLELARVERRRDRVVSRHRWQFALRDEAILKAPVP